MRLHRLFAVAAAGLALAQLVGGWYHSPLLPAAHALAWFAAAGVALTLPDLAPRTRYGLALAGVALGVLALPSGVAGPGMQFLSPAPPDPGLTGVQLRRWALLAVAGIGLVLAVSALPRRKAGQRRTAVAVALALLAGGLAMALGRGDVLPAYAVLVALAVLALRRSSAVAVALGLGLAAVTLLDGPWHGWGAWARPPSTQAGLEFLSPAEYRRRSAGAPWPTGVLTDALRFVAGALVLAGGRWAGRARERAHGAARPRS
ncbi:hypothetical protein GA0074695_5783 [Micromonospora viridifaciens]|uniref:Uncharacterized protein n=1 Tax=Micromonospora viridifaciens TaxID=1881 RepID=A0A1C4ZLM8_MICVI|nr:hypothetical protein [Micromonospora viridifaciens]SCF33835.1 hypothetical protein GA0074695_5783 [Micromonospora viridifaciens]